MRGGEGRGVLVTRNEERKEEKTIREEKKSSYLLQMLEFNSFTLYHLFDSRIIQFTSSYIIF